MIEVLDTIYNVIAPILIGMGVGAIFGRLFDPNPKTLSTTIIYIFSPCLVFEGMANADITASDLLRIGSLVFATMGIMLAIGQGVGKLMGLARRQRSALMLSVILFNGATYGFPFNEFAFGMEARQIAVVYFSISVIITNTVGVYLASRDSGISTRSAMLTIVKLPATYMIVMGLILNFSGMPISTIPGESAFPLPLARSISLLGGAAVPAMLIVLGIQLQRLTLSMQWLKPVVVASVCSLLVAPLVVALLAPVMGVTGMHRQVGIMQFAMPTAIIAGVLATEFGGDSEFVTSTVLLSTLASVLTLSVLLTFV